MLIKYVKSVLWRAAKRLSYIEDARCLKIKESTNIEHTEMQSALLIMSVSAVVLSHRNSATAGTLLVASVLGDKISGTFCIINTQ